MEVVSREQAKECGLRYFFTGTPCSHGHVSPRYVSTKNCLECQKVHAREWYRRNLEKGRAGVRAYRSRARERIQAQKRVRYFADRRPALLSRMIANAKLRAERAGVPFDLSVFDIDIPERCPVLGILLSHGDGKSHAASPTLDRIIPARGYVSGNVAVISHRANTIKQNATAEELLAVAAWVETQERKLWH